MSDVIPKKRTILRKLPEIPYARGELVLYREDYEDGTTMFYADCERHRIVEADTWENLKSKLVRKHLLFREDDTDHGAGA